MPARLHIRITGDKKWARVTGSVARNISGVAVQPVFNQLGDKLMMSFRELFSASSSGTGSGVTYAHGHTGNYLAGISKRVSSNELQITEGTPTGGRQLLEGTGPSSAVLPSGARAISGDVVRWAMSKLGVSNNEAFAIARSVATHGIGWHGGASPLQREHPAGEGRIAFPEYIILKNKTDFNTAAQAIGGLVVSYMEKG